MLGILLPVAQNQSVKAASCNLGSAGRGAVCRQHQTVPGRYHFAWKRVFSGEPGGFEDWQKSPEGFFPRVQLFVKAQGELLLCLADTVFPRLGGCVFFIPFRMSSTP